MPESRPSRAMTIMLPMMITGMLLPSPPRVKTTIIILAWTITNAPTRRKDTVLLK